MRSWRLLPLLFVLLTVFLCIPNTTARATPRPPVGWDCTQGNMSDACIEADLPPLPTPRGSLAATSGVDGLIYAIGGVAGVDAGQVPVNTVEAYDSAAGTWTTIAPMPTARFALAAATGSDGRIYALGGRAYPPDEVTDAAEAYNPSTQLWQTLSPMPTARWYLAAATGPDGRIYTFGGGLAEDVVAATVEIYDPTTDTWSSGAPMPTPRLAEVAVTGSDGRIYVIGGQDSHFTPVAIVEAYDPTTDTWTCSIDDPAAQGCATKTLTPMPTARFRMAATAGLNGRIYVLGGFNADISALDSVEVYRPAVDRWTIPSTVMPTAGADIAAATGVDGRVYVLGSYNAATGSNNTVEAYHAHRRRHGPASS